MKRKGTRCLIKKNLQRAIWGGAETQLMSTTLYVDMVLAALLFLRIALDDLVLHIYSTYISIGCNVQYDYDIAL